MDGNEKNAKNSLKYVCKKCDYATSKKSSYNEHLLSAKHTNSITIDNPPKKNNSGFICPNCHKTYKDNSGLWRHKKKCKENVIYNNDNDSLSDKELMLMIMKDNTELKKMMMGVLETGANVYNSNNVTNSHNKSFNLNLFLNETCKDAMNITDFINSIHINLEDLENTGKKGYIEGISNIFLKNLNSLEHHMRPLHCGDLKREILYVKDNNKWEKETNSKLILKNAIKTVAGENIKQITNWKNKYPDCTNSDSRKNDMYLKIVSNSMNGLTEEEGNKNINKIISNLAKQVVIEKG